jgi:hypothetical protein
MREVFYKYASSRAEKAIVDKHDIEQALTNWSWYWALVEAMPLCLLFMALSAIGKSFLPAIIFGCTFLTLSLSSMYFYARCKRYIRPQVDTIKADSTAIEHIRGVFREIQS